MQLLQLDFYRSVGIGRIALAMLAIACSASASVVFTTLPAVSSGGYGVVGPTSSRTIYNEFAVQFTPTATGTLTSIDVPFSHAFDSNQAVNFKLYTSVSNLPGSVLGTASIAAGTLTSSTVLYNLTFGSVALTAGTPYFLDAATTSDSWQSWAMSTTATLVPVVQINSLGGTFHSVGNLSVAFQVNADVGAATPEPGTLALLFGAALAFAGVKGKGRRKRS